MFLLAGAGWYPDLEGAEAVFSLSVTAPAGVLAVTAGRSTGHVTQNGATTSGWQVDRSVEGLSLSAARYVVDTLAVGTVTAATYFLEENRHLAADYLKATASYLDPVRPHVRPLPLCQVRRGGELLPHGIRVPVLHPAGRQRAPAPVHHLHQPGPRDRPLLVGQRGAGGPGRRQLVRGAHRLCGRLFLQGTGFAGGDR